MCGGVVQPKSTPDEINQTRKTNPPQKEREDNITKKSTENDNNNHNQKSWQKESRKKKQPKQKHGRNNHEKTTTRKNHLNHTHTTEEQPERTICAQLSNGSLNHAIHNAYHTSLPPTSLFKPTHPSSTLNTLRKHDIKNYPKRKNFQLSSSSLNHSTHDAQCLHFAAHRCSKHHLETINVNGN